MSDELWWNLAFDVGREWARTAPYRVRDDLLRGAWNEFIVPEHYDEELSRLLITRAGFSPDPGGAVWLTRGDDACEGLLAGMVVGEREQARQ